MVFSRALLAFVLCLGLVAPVLADDDDSPLNAGLLSGLKLRNLGPALMSGRIADIVSPPGDPGTWYVAVGSGGVWKTVNAGTTWAPIFDGQTSYSIGCLALDPSNPATIWAGTGENVSGRHVGWGDGIYRSRDGGKTWEKRGLERSEHIGRIAIHPDDPNTLWVAAQGPLWSPGGERGVYMTTDAGETWELVLGAGEYTGANEVVLDPTDPDVLYASLHHKFRDVAALIDGGPESGLHKSVDGGRTWRELKTGLPTEDMGKIGLAVSPQDPNVVYATIELAGRTGGFWRSNDGGESWEKRSDYVARGTGPHYYQEIFASPHAFDRIYHMDVRMHVSHDGGKTFVPVGEKHKHVDNHALLFSPDDPDYLLAGCDGGLYESWDLGKNWKFVANLPVTQFYKVAVDYDEPFYHVIGGTQDNNTQYGPVRTDNVHGLRNADWRVTLFGDGHQPAIDPTNPDIIYSSLQQCSHHRVDRPTGEVISIRPRPGRDEPRERWNWDGPILISAHDPARLYVASQRLWRSDDRGDGWRALSGDLTRGEDRLRRPMMGRVQSIDAVWDLAAMSMYGTVTSLAESPLDEDLLYVGTDDGLIQVSEDGGATWREAKRPPKVAEHVYVNDLKADRFDADTVYAVLDGHKRGDFTPYVFKSVDRGRSWKSIASDLPEAHVCWRIVQDPVVADLLFLGTEFGLFTSLDGGGRWLELTGGVPTIPIRDLVIQAREVDLVCASFGRGFFVLDDYSPLRGISESALAADALLFAPRDAWWYLPQRILGGGEKAAQGGAFYTAPNPPFGAVFTYYLQEGLTSRKDARKKAESELIEEGEDTPHPGWDEIRAEEVEDAPAILLTVRNDAGEVVRRVSGPVGKGLHRVAWDLRWPAVGAVTDGEADASASGTLAAPGEYTVELGRRVDGVYTKLAAEVGFAVKRLGEPGLQGMAPEAYAAFMREVAETEREMGAVGALWGETNDRVQAIKAALGRVDGGEPILYQTAVNLEKWLERLRVALWGHRTRSILNESQPIPVSRRLGAITGGNRGSTYGPTAMHREQYDIAREQLAEVRASLQLIVETELPVLESGLELHGVPWTPGRKLPASR